MSESLKATVAKAAAASDPETRAALAALGKIDWAKILAFLVKLWPLIQPLIPVTTDPLVDPTSV